MLLKDQISLLGKTVKVTLTYDNPKHIAVGKLLAFGDDGEAQIEDEMGFVHYCWPMLEVEAL